MKATIIYSLILAGGLCTAAHADEMSELKMEVQNLKERVTELNNAQPFKDTKNWGQGFTLGVPLGFTTGGGMIYGLELGYTVTPRVIIRLDAHFIYNPDISDRFKWGKYMQQSSGNNFATPSVGVVLRSPMIYNLRIYGGFFGGIWYDLDKKIGPNFSFKGFGGFEVYTNRHQSFFMEVGGGGVMGTRSHFPYSSGVIITGGSRFFI
jgi:hypothetical protein